MVQIAFVTLFLGLTLGPQPVELTVSGPVAAIELVLDGSPAGRIQGPPWTGKIDFGPGLEPHELVARALDDQGQEVGRTRQWINLPRPPAEIEVLLEPGAEGRVAVARITWQSLTGASPSSIDVTFDGKPLAVDKNGRVTLPHYKPETSHILTAELVFPGAVTARKDVVFGGKYGEEVSTELTGIPVRLREGKRLPPAEQLQGWFQAGDKPLSVAAVEEGPAQLVVVRDIFAVHHLWALDPRRPAKSQEEAMSRRRFEMTLGPEDEIQLVWPAATAYAGARAELFDMTRGYTAKDGGLFWILTRALPPRDDMPPQRLADALAVAGLRALDGHRRRAVLLVWGGEPGDKSRSHPAMVRHYLEKIRVPLYVWTVVKPQASPSPSLAAWGDVEDASTLGKLGKAFQELKEDLESQILVWVDGRHLPQSVTLSPAAAEVVELLGR